MIQSIIYFVFYFFMYLFMLNLHLSKYSAINMLEHSCLLQFHINKKNKST